MNDRAVSEVVGYVLVFSLIVSTVGIVTAVGFGNLGEQQQAEQVNNVERAFDVFQNNVEDVYRDGAPSRATEMRLGEGTLRYGETVNVTVRDASEHSRNHTRRVSPLVYSSGDTEIVYEAGAVIRDDGHGAVMLNRPPFRFGSKRTLLPVVRTTRSVGPVAISRPGTVRVGSAFRDVNTTTRTGVATADELEVVVESPRADAWERYFESQPDSVTEDVELNGNRAVFTFRTDSLQVPRYRIQLSYSD